MALSENIFEAAQFEEVVLEQMRHHVRMEIGGDAFRLKVTKHEVLGSMYERMAYELVATLTGKRNQIQETIKTPLTFWDAIKERCFPELWLKHFPVRYSERRIPVAVNRMCPHLATDHSGRHVRFCIAGESDGVQISYDEYSAFMQWQNQSKPYLGARTSFDCQLPSGLFVPAPKLSKRVLYWIQRNLVSPNQKF
jgi:hypothetical protein